MTAGSDGIVEVPRDRYGRPLIIPPGGGKPIPYNRASSFGDVLDDRTMLEKYLRRMAAKGIVQNPELGLAIATTPLDQKGKLDSLVEEAIEKAGGSKKATIGTGLHSLTEMIDRGEELPHVPLEYRDDLAAYEAATAVFEHVAVERFVVNDELQVAGTPDRISKALQSMMFGTPDDHFAVHAGDTHITDLKTGGHANYLGKYATQLAIYSRSEFYDPATGERSPIGDVDQYVGVLFHMPAGEGRCDLYALDLQAGWEGALLAAEVRQWRRRKGLAVRQTLAAKAEQEAA